MNIQENNQVCYLHQLPDEIKVKVLTYLDTPSLINLCEAYPSLEYLSHDKDTIHYVSFNRVYKYEGAFIQRFLTQRPRCKYITVLDINNVYWVPSPQLHKAIAKLKFLECLYAVDTKLSVTPEECQMYSSLKIRKIGLSLMGKDFTLKSVKHFPDVVGLYFLLYACTSDTLICIQRLMNKMRKLTDVWIIDSGYNMTQLICLTRCLPPTVHSATFGFHLSIDACKKITSFTKTFESREDALQICFEKCDDGVDIYDKWQTEHEIWNGLLNELHCKVPFGPKDAKKLSLKQNDLQNIHFEELNFAHIHTVCCIRLQNLVFKALMLPNCVKLKKLAINFCVCDETWRRDRNLQPYRKKQKSRHHDNDDGDVDDDDDGNVETANLRNIIRNCPFIEDLEIWGCEQAWSSSIPSLKYIKDLPKLKRLSLIQVPLQVDGRFLIDVCKSCSQLRSLKITPLHLNSKININVMEAIKYAKNLKDFRLEHMLLPIQEIIEHLTVHNKLERLYLKCTSSESFSRAIPEFCLNNPQLVFIMIIVKEMPKIKLSSIQNLLNLHKENAAQLFYCVQSEDIFTGRFPIPEVHRREIMKRNSAVRVLDVFNGFV